MSETTAQRTAGNLRALMARQRAKRSTLAAAWGLSLAAVSRRLSGETPMDVNELSVAAELLGVSTSQLLGEPAVVSQ